MIPWVIQVLQSLVVLTLAPLYAGVLARAEAVVGSKRGPSVRRFPCAAPRTTIRRDGPDRSTTRLR